MRIKIEGVYNKFGHWYEVDTDGNVFNGKTGRKLKPRKLKHKNYYRVGLPIGDVRVHRLVAETFIFNDDPENKIQVNHKNGVKSDNRVENLEWVTPSENLKHAYKIGLMSKKGEKNSNAKITRKDVEDIRMSNDTVTYLAERYDVTKNHIRRILSHKVWKNDKAL